MRGASVLARGRSEWQQERVGSQGRVAQGASGSSRRRERVATEAGVCGASEQEAEGARGGSGRQAAGRRQSVARDVHARRTHRRTGVRAEEEASCSYSR
jgi:hypothetical protein